MRASTETYKERETAKRLSTRSRILVAGASLLLLLVYLFPIWRIDLAAPQYPEGLGMYIEVHDVRGRHPGNLESINGLNHYIGMRPIRPDAIPELRWMPWIFLGLVVFGLATAASGRRWMLYTWVGAFLVLAVVGLADFYKWEYDYGHNLDQEHAIIKVPGMTYQPPLLGSKKMLNITATSLPALGGIATILSLLVGLYVVVAEVKLRRAAAGLAAVTVLLLTACSSGPRPIRYGEEACAHCMMTISDARFGGEIVTQHGKVLPFDAVECMTGYLASAHPEYSSLWVVDFDDPGTLLPADKAFFVHTPSVHTPMNGGFLAFATSTAREAFLSGHDGEALSWNEVLEAASDAPVTSSSL